MGDESHSGELSSFEGQNVILIQCETCEQYAFSRAYTPNYYRLYDEGIRFDNFYSAAKSNYTYDAEMKALSSMMYFQADNFMYSFGEMLQSFTFANSEIEL